MNNTTPTLFTNEEEQKLSERSALDETDRRILALMLIHPLWSNEDIGEEVGLNRIQVWRRKTKGPLGPILLEFQREAIHSASDLVINEARGAIKRLGELARGECECSKIIKEQSDNHRQACMNPVPYAVQRQAAKDLVEILSSRKKEEIEDEEEIWESVVSEVGGIQVRKQAGKMIDITPEISERGTNS